MAYRASIQLKQISFSIPDTAVCFDGLDLNFDCCRYGIVGDNGIGKTTLLRLISGDIAAHQGVVQTHGSQVVCPQQFKASSSMQVAEVLGVADKLAALARVEHGEADEQDYDLLAEHWDIKAQIDSVFDSLRLTLSLDHLFSHLSGGQQTKVLLARCLLSRSDFTVLDEPTNHLDKFGRELLKSWLAKNNKGVIVVSHDRDLLNQVDCIIELSRLGVKQYGGNYDFYEQQKAIELAAAEHEAHAQSEKLEKAKRQVQTRMERHQQNEARGKRGKYAQIKAKGSYDKLAFNSMKGRSEKTNRRIRLQASRKLEGINQDLKEAKSRLEVKTAIHADIDATVVPASKRIIEVSDLKFAYPGGEQLFNQLSFELIGPERVALVGENGCGKSTIVKLILGQLSPLAGEVSLGVEHWCYLDQQVSLLRPELTIIENYQLLNEGVNLEQSYFALASMNFRDGEARKQVAHLSGGERLRAGLAISLLSVKPPQLIVLDEPANHLDLRSIKVIEEMLSSYQGALLVISHDECFLQQIKVDRYFDVSVG